MACEIALTTSDIFVLRKVRISSLSKRLDNLPAVALEHSVVLLLGNVTLANGFQPESTAGFHLYPV
jgi:hypothetical protein